MKELAGYTKYIEDNISSITFPDQPSELYDPLRYFLKLGGKRIRPILTLLGAEMFDADKESAASQALAIELFHNFTLIHDDIMDEAPLRRNQQTVHEKWNENVGILSGDALLIIAYQHLCNAPTEKIPALMELFNRTALEVCDGQQMDMDFESRMDVTVAEYIEMIRLKTSVLLGCALRIGAIMGGASEKDQDLLYNYGVNIGIAFQIQDDILDLYADPEKFGKQIGGDVLANKKTILYLTAVGNSNPNQLMALKQLQEEQDANVKLSRTREIFDHLNIKESCKEVMNKHYQQAILSLEKVEVDEAHKQTLRALGQYLMQREY
jgi:geranylgeranyl diphosphate synthase type II